MEQAEQLSEQQKQDLQELVESQQLSKEELQQLSEATEQMAKECKEANPNPRASPVKLSRQLSKMEQLKQMLKQARDTSEQCRSHSPRGSESARVPRPARADGVRSRQPHDGHGHGRCPGRHPLRWSGHRGTAGGGHAADR